MSVIVEKTGRITIITINRKEVMNAIDIETNNELKNAWRDFKEDDEQWVAILTGAGDQAFSAGADLKKLIPYKAKMSVTERKQENEAEYGSFGAITKNFHCQKPMIAAINGLAFGGGLEMAMACDIRIASTNARMGLTEARWGILPGAGGTQRLPRLVPLSSAMEMLMTANPIDAEEAYRIGLVSRIVEPHLLMDIAFEIANTICERAPLAVRAIKEATMTGLDLPFEHGLGVESNLQEYLRQTEDSKEGPKAFKEKRKANFQAK